MSSDSPQLVDDTTPAVQYAPGWIWDQLVDEVDHTRHGAAIAGLTASLGFSGTGIAVVGTLGSSDTNGQPKTTYAIDGTVVGTYNAPVTPSGQTHYNVTFFSKQDLSPGDHEIVITNVDGTNPNHYWLDYFLIYKSPPADTHQATTTTTQAPSPTTTQPPATTHSFSSTVTTTTTQNPTTSSTIAKSPSSSNSSSTSPSGSSSSPSTPTTISNSSISTTPSFDKSQSTVTFAPFEVSGTTVTAAGSTATSTTTSLTPVGANVSQQKGATINVGAVAGGVAGGIVLLILLLLIFFLLRRRRQRAHKDIEPFGAASPQDHYAFAPHRTATSRSNGSGHTVKSPEMYFNQSAFVSRRSAAAPDFHASLNEQDTASASAHADYSRARPTTATIPDPLAPNRPAPSPGAHRPQAKGTAHAQESTTVYSSSSPTVTSSTAYLSPARYQPAPASPQSDSTSPVTPGSTTSLLLHTEVAGAPWYAPPQGQSRAQSLLRALTSRGGRRSSGAASTVVQDVDSGLRTYNEATLPPPYTPE